MKQVKKPVPVTKEPDYVKNPNGKNVSQADLEVFKKKGG